MLSMRRQRPWEMVLVRRESSSPGQIDRPPGQDDVHQTSFDLIRLGIQDPPFEMRERAITIPIAPQPRISEEQKEGDRRDAVLESVHPLISHRRGSRAGGRKAYLL